MKFILLALASLMLVASCQAAKPQTATTAAEPALDEKAVLEMATPMLEELLNAIHQNDYDGFTKNFNEKMMAASTSESFAALQKTLSENYGKFQIIEFQQLTADKGYLNVFYSVKFEKGSLTVQLVLDSEPPNKIAGLWFR